MTRALAIQAGIATLLGTTGLTLLARPGIVRRLLGAPDNREATYAMRIAGMMLTMLGVMIGGFGAIFHFASAP